MSEAKSLLCSQDSIPPVSPSTSPFSVSIGTGNIIHPLCKFEPQNGPIMIGNNNIFEEHVVVTNRNSNEEPLVIGDGNVIEVGANFSGSRIGDNCTISSRSYVKRGASLGDNCVLSVGAETRPRQIIPDSTILYMCNGRVMMEQLESTSNVEMESSAHLKHLEYLREILPKYHHVQLL